jgi:hypothetical protein
VELVGLRLRLDEDVTNVARLGDRVLVLVLVVVLLQVGVGDLDVVRDVLVDLLGDQLGLDVLPEGSDGVPLRGEARLELLLVVLEVLLLDLVDLLLDLGVGDLDPEVVGLLAVLRALNQVRDRLVLQRLELRRAGLRELALLRRVRLLDARDELVEVGLRDRGAIDDGDRVGRDLVGVAAAGGDDGDSRESGGGEQERALHRDLVIGDAVLGTGCAVFGD